jgi:hypothetical protein
VGSKALYGDFGGVSALPPITTKCQTRDYVCEGATIDHIGGRPSRW